jgi:hypothetical protein
MPTRPTREDIELYVSGNFDGDVAALERAIAEDPALAAMVAEEAKLELLLRDAAAAATFCPACDALVRVERCDQCGAAMRPGGFTVERVLVSNAHGRMYLAHDADGKRVALKELAFLHAPSAAAVAAFEREAKFLRALEHPAIPRFCASFEEGQGVHTRYYLAQELVEGTSLDKLDEHWYSETEIVDIAKQVLSILEYLQSLSPMVIHRDIKPANLLKRPDGSIALVDFGAAHAHGATAGVTTIGTFGYMPTEQLAGIVDSTTDLYALGASLLHLLTRQEPWKLAQSKTTVNVSAPLRAFLDKLVAPDPKDRFPDAKAALAGLEARDSLVTRKPQSMGRARMAIAAVVGTALVAAASINIYKIETHRSSAKQAMSREDEVRAATELARQAAERAFADAEHAQAKSGRTTVRVLAPTGSRLQLDGAEIAPVKNGDTLEVASGTHAIKITLPDGKTCEDTMTLEPGEVKVLDCGAPPTRTPVAMPPAAKLVLPQHMSKTFKDRPLAATLSDLSEACGVSFVLPDGIQAKITAELSDVPCDQGIEVILESNGLWYDYNESAKLLRISPRRQLDAEREAAMARQGEMLGGDDALPPGPKIDLDFKDAPLHDVLRVIGASGEVNIVVPDGVRGKTSIRLKQVPWDNALQAVLAAHGLWYRYRENGRIVRVAPRRELDGEAEAAQQRASQELINRVREGR